MTVTMAVPTAGESSTLRESIESMAFAAARAGSDAELLVVVNGYRGPLPALEHLDAPSVRVLHLDRANVARARNVGIAEARHDTVIFGDDGATVPATWCTDIAAALRDPRYPVVTAPVRVPVRGPVTAFLDYQRVFDAPPVDAEEALTVTGALGLRRDRLPARLRYDEANLPLVGEDAAFGLGLRAAGIKIRWLGGVAPGLHVLAERIEEITDRGMRYGGGAATVWCRRLGPVPGPDDVLGIYRSLASGGYDQYRRFHEILDPAARAAFAVFEYMFTMAWLVGYLAEFGVEDERPVIDLDRDALRQRWRDVAGRAGAGAVDWTALPLDYTLLDSGAATHDPLVAEARHALNKHAALLPRPMFDGGPAVGGAVEGPGGAGRRRAADRLPRLGSAWRTLRDSGAQIAADALDELVRAAGFGFREGCATIERAAGGPVA